MELLQSRSHLAQRATQTFMHQRTEATADSKELQVWREDDEMTVKDLEIFFDYGYWANKQFFGLLPQLSAEQFTQPVAGICGSVRNTDGSHPKRGVGLA